MAIFTKVAGRRDGRRHIIVTSGAASTFPVAMCASPIALRDDALLPPCADCQAKAVAEAALALETLGLVDLAVRVSRVASDLSFETKKAQSDADLAPGEWAEMFGR